MTLLVKSYRRKNKIFYEKNVKIRNNYYFIMLFVIDIFLTVASCQFLENANM